MDRVVVVAPHPDDETLGPGGTLLKHRARGDELHWLIMTRMDEASGFSPQRIAARAKEIETVAGSYGFASVHKAEFPATSLDALPMGKIVDVVSRAFKAINPTIVYLPFRGDIHTDHWVVFDAVAACTKWFRYGSIRRVLAYETLSETDLGINPDVGAFRPNVFVDISEHLEKKIEIMRVFQSEMGGFPFPRSEEALRALARFRGTLSGFQAAEAFMLLKETVK